MNFRHREDSCYVKPHSVFKNNFLPFTVEVAIFVPRAKVKEGHGNPGPLT